MNEFADTTFAAPKRRFNWLFAIGVTIVAGVTLLALIGPYIGPYDPTLTTPRVSVPPPSLSEIPGLLFGSFSNTLEHPPHWMGTDSSGYDVFSRVIAAPRTDLTIALAANFVSLGIGAVLGLLAGYFRNWGTELLMRVSDVLQSFPVFISAMVLVALAGRSMGNIVLALALVYTPIYIRLTRAEVLQKKVAGYVEAARAMGTPEIAIAFRHVLPNSMTPALIQSSVTIGFAILLTSGLSFVGAGVRPPTPEWGLSISTGANQIILGEWWPSVFPGIAISITVFGFAVLGNALEERYE
ncbi:ABC transporter permease [Celeribacter litoreus]|uniref:ABC transporter permease n=1 Tax=Celeribacter litoreus TaxID=2876714 RepID=UPI001CCFFDBE|nr:ABC transporter permease [Celeribacter litoreus]MCA0042522.1 ABC transporter permease [Celeribacter litoreus]